MNIRQFIFEYINYNLQMSLNYILYTCTMINTSFYDYQYYSRIVLVNFS